MPETFLAIVTAHLLGDFVFQSQRMVNNKQHVLVLAAHVAIVTLTSFVLLGSAQWQILVGVSASHLVIDSLKLRFGKEGAISFITDQLAHVFVALLLAWSFGEAASAGWWPGYLDVRTLNWYYAAQCLISGVILVLNAGGILVGKLTKPFSEEITRPEKGTVIAETDADYPVAGLTNGGKYIGWLERFLTLLLILIGQPTGIGFLIAAKSVLRFGEIRESRHRKVAEYIIIGTFLSFGWALLISVLTQKSIQHWLPPKEPVQQLLIMPSSTPLQLPPTP